MYLCHLEPSFRPLGPSIVSPTSSPAILHLNLWGSSSGWEGQGNVGPCEVLKLGLGEKGGIHEEYDKHPIRVQVISLSLGFETTVKMFFWRFFWLMNTC